MNKKEQAEMDRLCKAVAEARAMRWPEYEYPAQIETPPTYSRGTFTRGWWAHAYGLEWRVGEGVSDGVHHSTHNLERTTTQGPGKFYASRIDALRVARLKLTEQFAQVLARLDAEIEREMKGK